MATMTALIAVGMPHPNRDGLIPTHVAWLSENGRPVWVLRPATIGAGSENPADHQPPHEQVVWVPHKPDTILEDGLLLIGVQVLRDLGLRELADTISPALIEDQFVELEKLPSGQLTAMRTHSSEIDMGHKLVVTVLTHSSLEKQLAVLERYSMQVEVCTV